MGNFEELQNSVRKMQESILAIKRISDTARPKGGWPTKVLEPGFFGQDDDPIEARLFAIEKTLESLSESVTGLYVIEMDRRPPPSTP